MIKSSTKGFTLIEIVVAVAIVGVLAAVATVFYKDYVTRSRVSEALVFADAGRTRLEVDWAAGQRRSQQEDLLNAAGKPVDMMTGLTWVRGTPADAYVGYIMAEMNLPGFGKRKVLALELRSTGDWHCVGAARFAKPEESLDEKYLPAQCRDGQAVAKVGAPASQPVAPTGQAAAPAVACPTGQDKVQTTDAKGIAISLCLPACPAGQTRNAQDPSRCDPPAQPLVQCQPNEMPYNGPWGGACNRVCNSGQFYDPASPTKCSATPPAAAQPPAAQPTNPAPAGVTPKETLLNNVKYELQVVPPMQMAGASTKDTICLRLAPGQNPPAPVKVTPCPPGTLPNGSGWCRPISICAINPVAPNGKPDANTCPPGMVYYLAGQPAVGPSGLTGAGAATGNALPKNWDNSRGVCVDPQQDGSGITYSRQYNLPSTPALAYKAVQCEACSGPVAICENLHRTVTCQWPMNVCANELTNHADTGRQVVRGCSNIQNAYTEWFQKFSANDKCVNFNENFVYTADFYCSYSCSGDKCNARVNPAAKWSNLK